mmetsp:Transcript_13884/g.43709  ORF Transcript_13884/g.43709 Transcript_13884/m.43709 type:complete len:93 (-) Transcript_13884:1251-1529(-)
MSVSIDFDNIAVPVATEPQSTDALLARIKNLEAELGEARKRVATVERNASALYRTARAELDRKDALIDQLNSELSRERERAKGRGRGSGHSC